MTIPKILIILFATVLILSLFIVIIFISVSNTKKTIKEKWLNKLNKNNDSISMEKIEQQLIRIENIYENNEDFKNSFSIFDNKYGTILKKQENTRAKILELKKEIRLNVTKNIKQQFSKIDFHAKIIEKEIENFYNEANTLLEGEHYIKKEMNFYIDRYQTIKNVFQKRIVQIMPISQDLENKNKEIIALNCKFEDFFNKGKINDCALTISKYRDKIIEFAKILDLSPIINEKIKKFIPNETIKLHNLYTDTKKILGPTITYINFRGSITSIFQKYKILEKKFRELKVDECKEIITWITKNLKSLELSIRWELESYRIYRDNYDAFCSITKDNFNNYVELLKKSKQNNNFISKSFHDLHLSLKNLMKQIDIDAMQIKNEYHNNEMPYSSRLLKMSQNLNAQMSLVKLMNSFIEQLSIIDNYRLNFYNQFKYISVIMCSLESNIKSLKIKLTMEEENQIKLVNQNIYQIEESLSDKSLNYHVIENKFTTINRKISWLFEVTGAKKETIKTINNLLAILARHRSTKLELNAKLNLAEKQLLLGEYMKSLNTIIAGLEGVK